jgi:hypothetical protein
LAGVLVAILAIRRESAASVADLGDDSVGCASVAE